MSARVTPVPKLIRLAEMDIEDAMEWYSARSPAAGEAFVRAVDDGLAQIREFPEGAPLVYKKARRLLLHGFPYGVFYVYERQRVRVLAVMHWRRDPHDWQSRVR